VWRRRWRKHGPGWSGSDGATADRWAFGIARSARFADAVANIKANAGAHGNANVCAYSNADTGANRNANAGTHGNADTGANRNANAGTHGNTNAGAHRYTNR